MWCLRGGRMKRGSMEWHSSSTTIVMRGLARGWVVLDGVWSRDHFSYAGKYYRVEDNVLEPKPVSKPRPCLYAGGESAAAKDLIAEKCDAYLRHGDPPERVGEKISDLRARRARFNLPPMKFGVAGYAIVRETEREAQDEGRGITDVKQSAAGYANYQQWLAGTQLGP